MIYCVWYPSGGFGHFINSVLNLYGTNFVRPKKQLVFSDNGNSHDLDYVAPSYIKNQDYYKFNFDPLHNYGVIVDNGINNETTEFQKFFPDSKIIKMCYDDTSWPVVANTMIHKAMVSSFDNELVLNTDQWPTDSPWTLREKYFLFLRDHPLRFQWRPDACFVSILLQDLITYQTTKQAIQTSEVVLDNFESTWDQWWSSNKKYFDPIIKAQALIAGEWPDISSTDVWTQAVVYYQIWCTYGVEVPHNDFENFFESQEQYTQWITSIA